MNDLYNNGERPEETDPSSIIRSKNKYKTVLKFIRNQETVIDFGCGLGYGYQILKDHTSFYTGIDVSENVIEAAKIKNEIRDLDSFKFIKNIHQLSFLSKHDFFICLEVLEHLEEQDVTYLLNFISSKNLKCYFTTPNGNFYPYHPKTKEQRRGHHVWHYTYHELEDLFRKYFSYVDVFGLEYDKNLNVFVSFGVYVYGSCLRL